MADDSTPPEGPPPGPGGADPTDSQEIEALFTRSDGSFRFARWGRALAPAIYGTDAAGSALFEETIASLAGLAGLNLVEEDPELGANFLVFMVNDWRDLSAIPHLDKLIPDLAKLVSMLSGAGANQYRIFGFDGDGAIRICVTLIRYDEDMRQVSAQTVAVSQTVMALLLWSDHAFTGTSPIATIEGGRTVVKPWHADLIRAAYDRVLPPCATDPAFALRLAARMAVVGGSDAADGSGRSGGSA